jgi:hypothetical protein
MKIIYIYIRCYTRETKMIIIIFLKLIKIEFLILKKINILYSFFIIVTEKLYIFIIIS